MVQNLQLAVYGVLSCFTLYLTYMISPPEGTLWYMITGSLGYCDFHSIVLIVAATVHGFWGTFQRDARFTLGEQPHVHPRHSPFCCHPRYPFE